MDRKSILRKPEWLKVNLSHTKGYAQTGAIVREGLLNTICTSGRCPNQCECWARGTATFMICGDICTRSCRFCATKSGRPAPLDKDEPERVALSVKRLGLKHCVITSVDRDDLPDGGAAHWSETVRAIKKHNPHTTVELLIPDFDGRAGLLDIIIASGADIVGHNIETVERLTPQVRSRARYELSLSVLRYLKEHGARVKSGLMVGLGESDDEVVATLRDLHGAGCSIVTIGQYLQPTLDHHELKRYVHPDTFADYKRRAEEIGFDFVASAPMVRSSYMAEQALAGINDRATQ
ncbi:MAG: lipoyl synthase [Rikenellaceae bacterium]|nr:lipoyl synthase [Rikenellaceae bacterium]MDE7356253.1 lipoyl synthase [Rikenellaceae bacterium]